MLFIGNKRGQLALIIIIALVIVAAVLVYIFVFRESTSEASEFESVYNAYAGCIKNSLSEAVEIAGSQGGRIYVENYEAGSEFAPSGSELNFLGSRIPYWFYVTGNGLLRENVPSKNEIERDISRYVESKLSGCDFSSFYSEGYEINIGPVSARSSISDNKVDIDVNSVLSVSKGDSRGRKERHSVSVNSRFGSFYNTARDVYGKQRRDAFLENYTIDVMRMYAPVDGVELSCAPMIWRTGEVFDELIEGLQNNIASLKFKGDYYALSNKRNNYFVVNQNVRDAVNLIYSRDWPTKIDIYGDGVDNSLMIAEPVGNEEGLGILGFCYVPYHFVYDIKYPVLIQIYNNNELFQFPVIVVIDKNLPRQGIYAPLDYEPENDLCQFMTQDISVKIRDVNLNNVNANISYTCFNQKCNLGQSVNGEFAGKAPACVNGYLEVRSAGYTTKRELFSTNSEFSKEIILDREYNVKITVKLDGRIVGGNVIVAFDGPKRITTSLENSEGVELSEGLYNITVYAYGNSSIRIPGSTKTECRDVPRSGLLGIFGATKEECFDITIPETNVDYALIGGGKGQIYILESELKDGRIVLNGEGLPTPNSIEQLGYNFGLFNSLRLNLEYG